MEECPRGLWYRFAKAMCRNAPQVRILSLPQSPDRKPQRLVSRDFLRKGAMDSREMDTDPEWIEVQERETERENLRFELLALLDIYGLDFRELEKELDQLRRSAFLRLDNPQWVCKDCSVVVRGEAYGDEHEYYNVHDDIWAQSGLGPNDGMLCIGCLEKRIGRELKSDDFGNCLINTHPLYIRSERFTDRLART